MVGAHAAETISYRLQDRAVPLDPFAVFILFFVRAGRLLRALLAANDAVRLDEGARVVAAAVTPTEGAMVRGNRRLDGQLQLPSHGFSLSFCRFTRDAREKEQAAYHELSN